MTLPASGNPISLSQVNSELIRSGTAILSMDDSEMRKMLQVGASGSVISMSNGYSKYRIGLFDTYNCNFTNYGTYGLFRVRVLGCAANAQIFIQLYSTTSGQPLGTSQYYMTCDANGTGDYTTTISGSDAYWFPASKTNWFSVIQSNVNNIGNFATSS